jgi:hypothetical protein
MNLGGLLSDDTYFRIVGILPTRLSTKLTFRSHWRTKEGGHPVRAVAPTLVLLGCCRCSGATSAGKLCFGQYVAIETPCSQALLAVINEGAGWLVQQYISEVSESEDAPVTEESSDDWEDASDQTDAEEEDAEEAIEELYGPFRYAEM